MANLRTQRSPWVGTYSGLMRILSSSFSCEYKVRRLLHTLFIPNADIPDAVDSPVDPGDTLLNHYLIATWAKICQAMGPEFEPYLPVVMPPLVNAAGTKADISVYGMSDIECTELSLTNTFIEEDNENVEEREGWETLQLDGQTVGIRTSAIEEKCQAFETLVIYCSTLQARFAPYLAQSLELTLPSLRFYFHDGVREACAM